MSTESPGWSWEPNLAWEGFGPPPPPTRSPARRRRRSFAARREARRRAVLALALIVGVAFAAGLSTALLTERSDPASPVVIGAANSRSAGHSTVGPVGHRLTAIARCESGGDPNAISPDGRYRGKYQFDLRAWRSVGGTGDPALAPERVQDRRARVLLLRRGTAPWPVCGTAPIH